LYRQALQEKGRSKKFEESNLWYLSCMPNCQTDFQVNHVDQIKLQGIEYAYSNNLRIYISKVFDKRK